MEKFKIYVLLNPSTSEEKKVLLTNSENLSSAATFDEKFSIGKHDESSLSFSVAEVLDNGEENPYLKHLVPESVIALDLVDRKPIHDRNQGWAEGQLIKYKIKGRQPRINKSQVIWDFTCKDYASTIYSKEAQGLSIDKTGTLQELTEEILGVSRKNTLYENLNIDLVDEFYFPGLEEKGFINNPPYLTYRAGNLTPFTTNPIQPFKRFNKHKKMVIGTTYDLQFDLINSSYVATGPEEALYMDIHVRQLDAAGSQRDEEIYRLYNNTAGVPEMIRIPFTLKENTTYIDVLLSSGEEDAPKQWSDYAAISGIYNIVAANFKISRNKDHLVELTKSDPLHLNNLQNLESFNSYAGLIGYQDTKMTFTIENSNLYNALVELATLFEAEVRFDYEDNAFYYVNTAANKFRGYRLHPEVNLLSINRPETSTDFSSIMHLRGSDDVNSVIPALPEEWRAYFLECVKNDFSTTDYFKEYGTGEGQHTYTSIAEDILLPRISGYDNYYERQEEIMKFAKQMDKIPNFDGTLYDFKYFLNAGLISEEKYANLMTLLYDDIRKLNITANIRSYQYYTIFSKYSEQQTQIAYYILGINNEKKFQFNSSQKLDITLNPDSPRLYTSAWVSLMNQINASESQEQDFRDSLRRTLGMSGPGVSMAEDSFLFNVMNLFGYEDIETNGITYLLEENNKAILEKQQEQTDIIKIINSIQAKMHINSHGHEVLISSLISGGIATSQELVNLGIPTNIHNQTLSTLSINQREKLINFIILKESRLADFFQIVASSPVNYSYENEALQIDLAGYQNRLTRTYDYLGFRHNDLIYYPGTLRIEREYLENMLSIITLEPYPETLSLYNILFNKEHEDNITLQKEILLEALYHEYEAYSIEGTYENSDEIDAYGLLEQGLRSFVYFSRPKIEYGISAIEIGAIENYKHLPFVEVGEKVHVGNFYRTYHENEETEYLIVTEFSLNLRDPSSLSLQVVQDDETDRLVKELLKSVNLVKIQPYKQKSNLVLSVPREITDTKTISNYYNIDSYAGETTEIVSNNISLFRDMYIKEPLYQPIQQSKY